MKKPAYEDYANRAFRFYMRNQELCTREVYAEDHSVDWLNWTFCNEVVQELNAEEREILWNIYYPKRNILDAVDDIAQSTGVRKNNIWALLNRTTRSFAKKRGLI